MENVNFLIERAASNKFIVRLLENLEILDDLSFSKSLTGIFRKMHLENDGKTASNLKWPFKSFETAAEDHISVQNRDA